MGSHFLGVQQYLDDEELGNFSRLPGPEISADGLTRPKSVAAPFVPMLQSGSFGPGALRPLHGVSFVETPGGCIIYLFLYFLFSFFFCFIPRCTLHGAVPHDLFFVQGKQGGFYFRQQWTTAFVLAVSA